MVLFQSSKDPKYQLLENPQRKCSFIAHSWAVFGLIVLSISIMLISLIVIWDQIKQMQHKTETLDFVLFGPKREISDVTRFSEYRALAYALANTSDINNSSSQFVPNESAETFQHVSKNYSLVCYYVTPSRSSPSDRLYPANIDPFLCTHIIIAFASVDKNRIYFIDDDTIIDSVVKLKRKNPKLKLLMSVVSFNSQDVGFPVMVTNETNRKEFIDSAIQLMTEYSLDGIDLDWEFPAWPVSKNITQKDQFTQLLQEMRMYFKTKYLISVAVAAPFPIVVRAYDVPAIAKYADFVNIMCYDYHSFVWYLPLTGPNAPLYAGPTDSGYEQTLNTNYTIHFWLQSGMPKNKIMLGMPIYGHSWTLSDPSDHDFGAVAVGFGNIGEKGFVSYRDVCKFLESKKTKSVFNGDMRVPYAYKEKEWISYDNQQSLSYKAEYVTEMGLGGAMIFSLNHDDFDGTICQFYRKFQLVNQIKLVLQDNNL